MINKLSGGYDVRQGQITGNPGPSPGSVPPGSNFNSLEIKMFTAESVHQAVKQLPPAELAKFRRWYARFDADVRDAQIEADAAAGKLDALTTDTSDAMTEAMNRAVEQLAETRPDPFLTASARRVLERIDHHS